MKAYGKHFQTEKTPQAEAIPGKSQVTNAAGGYVFAVDDWTRLDRFLILGAEGGTYYAGERQLTKDNAESVMRCLKADGVRLVNRVSEISVSGRAPKNDAALFVLAMAAGLGDDATKRAAFDALLKVARIGTHLFTFVENVKGFRRWGRGLRNGIARWYNGQSVDRLAVQLLKYRQRGGWSHRDVLRLAHPKPATNVHNALYEFVTKEKASDLLPDLVRVVAELQTAGVDEAVRLIRANKDVTWEMLPTELLANKEIWEALLPQLPMTAMIRNLGRMTANEALTPMSNGIGLVTKRLRDETELKKAHVHPIAILGALCTYEQGHGQKGKLSWEPIAQIVDALNDAFYLSFGNVAPTGKRLLLALDVSGSMSTGEVGGMAGLTPRNASAALALVTANVETNYHIMGFSTKFMPISVSPRERLDSVVAKISGLPFNGTDCALPMVWALRNKVEVDTFVVYTDNETWAGNSHPVQALKEYRRKMGIPAKLIVVGMTATGSSIADPNDAGMLDVVGFDTATPQLISDFIAQ